MDEESERQRKGIRRDREECTGRERTGLHYSD